MNKERGFTLIELLLYISIISIILLATSAFLYSIINARVKNQTLSEVEGQGTQVMQILTQTIRNSALISSPANGATGTILSVNTPVAGNNPTVFDLSAGVLRMKEGTASVIPLTNSRVAVSDLSFQNLNNSIRIRFTITHINPGTLNEFTYSENFYGTSNLRP